MISHDALRDMSAADLEALKAQADAVLRERQEASRREALEQARAILDAAGLTFAEAAQLATEPPRKRAAARGPVYRAGERYVNPANPAQSWTVGKGRPPKWLGTLATAGEPAVPAEE